MPAKSRQFVEENIFNMTCDKLRKELKKKRLSAAGKKSDLQFRLVEFLNSQREADQQETINEEPENEQDEPNIEEPTGELMEVDEPGTPSNRTFTVEENAEEVANKSNHEKTPTTSIDGLVLDEDAKRKMCESMGIDLNNFEVKSRPRAHRAAGRKSLRPTDVVDSDTQDLPVEDVTENRGATPVRNREPSQGRDRFAMIHAREMEKEETLGERRERIQKRHDDLTLNVPESIKRLATPKSVKKREPLDRSVSRSAARNWTVQNPAQMTFKFGDSDVNDYSSVANARKETGESSSTGDTVVQRPASRVRAHIDAKQLSRIPRSSRTAVTPNRVKTVIPSTLPDDDTFTDYISTPKGTTPSKTPKRGGYTPHTSKKVFVDTTQLTDREYKLAMEEGLIPGKPATISNLEKRQLESKKRRDDIVALKRKMNIK